MVSLIVAGGLIFFASILSANILSFTANNFSRSAVLNIERWCNSILKIYASEEYEPFFPGRIKYILCNFIVEVFKLLDRINNEHLRTGMKLACVFLFVLILVFILITLTVSILYFAVFVLTFYILYRLLQMWSRSQRGLTFFDNTDKEQCVWRPEISYNDKSIIRNEEIHGKETISFSEWDRFLGDQKR